ncbi:uridine permease-like protein Fui1 [Hortaea werneckii]|nr:uridine permease-like protein Fui1 [Hortaea werneckii]KAI6849182.1 uridine permease-like protein Fui1 [Hortaea werneckii]KAI6938891.1 uridine permease-like protein Fui1 [Hortaea werneckii]KAI6946588.1 uridine permease-like protein Fui1 [Hortaea werneckii]KAI6977891.1 uridine permease-like protein Fui1 [Hortaea werneckii]
MLKAELPVTTVVQLNYRLGGEHLYPQHIHDTLAGYDWIKTHLLPKRGILRAGRAEHIGRIAVSGEHIGGGLAAMLAVTECRIGEAGVVAAALNNPIVDWVGLDDGKESHPASEEMEDLLLTARDKLFKRPGHYFDSFASPVLFFRSPGKEVPKFSVSGPLDDLEHLAYLEREDFFRQQLALSAIPNRLNDVETQEEVEEEEDSNPGKTKSPRKTSKRYPSPSLGLKLPPFHISSGSLSPLSEQADEMAQLLRKSFLRTAQTSDFGRKILLPEEIAKLSDEEKSERQALVAEAYEMVELIIVSHAICNDPGLRLDYALAPKKAGFGDQCNTIMGIIITINGRMGATLHTPFPVLSRMPFGYYFSYFVVLSRCVLAIVWLGVQTATGGQCMNVLLTAIWPSFANLPNHIPEDQGITSAGMVAFLLYFLLQIPFLCIPYTKVQYFFAFKSIIAPICFLAIFGDTLNKAGGTIYHSEIITKGTTAHGSVLAWAFFSNLNSVLGNYATLGLNIADFSRYANKTSAQNVQAIVIPFIFTVVGLLGIFTAAAAQPVYGEALWNPIDIITHWMDSGSHSGRAAAAFAAIGLLIVTLGINISANSISAANDLMAFCPRYINIRRGQLLAAFIGSWAFVPWKILASAAEFLAFLSGYTIFLGPMTSILITDYFIVRRGNVSVPDMYNFHGMYRYSAKFATNWRSVVAFLAGCIPPLPGFVDNIATAGGETTGVSLGGQHLFAIGYVYSFISAGLIYWLLNRFFPHADSAMDHAETGEDIIAANDAHNVDERRTSCSEGRKPNILVRAFKV